MNSKFRINPQLSTTPGPEMQSQWLGKTREKTKKKQKKKNKKKTNKPHWWSFSDYHLRSVTFFVNVTIPLKIRMKR